MEFGFTVSANIKFIKPVPTGKEIYIIGEILDKSGDKFKIFTQILNDSGKILATMESIWKVAPPSLVTKLTNVDRVKMEERMKTVAGHLEEYKNNIKLYN